MKRSRVHEEPKVASDHAAPISKAKAFSGSANKLTIWQKSLLFNGRGYTVYDNSTGRLIFRVDNYASDWRMEMFLMDSTGIVLFTIKRSPKLSLLERWEVFRGEIKDEGKPFIKARKAFGIASCKVSSAAGDEYEMRWSAGEGWSKIYQTTAGTLLVAEVNRKQLGKATPGFLIGKDVYSLTVYPGMDQATAMALVMINDAIR